MNSFIVGLAIILTHGGMYYHPPKPKYTQWGFTMSYNIYPWPNPCWDKDVKYKYFMGKPGTWVVETEE
jgi:hypothetical protein